MKRRTEVLGIAGLTTFFFVLSLSRLGDVSRLYFDEPAYVHSGVSLAQFMLPLSIDENPHPPLAKLLIGLGVLIFGQNPVGWRFFEAVFAALMIPVLYLLARRMFGPGLFAVLPPVLLTFDFMHFVLAKLAILDGIFGFFALIMQYAFYEYYKYARQNAYADSTIRLVMAAIAFGLAFATKWPAAFSLVGFAVIFVYLTWRRLQRKQAKHVANIRRMLRPIIIPILCLILAGVVYLLAWLPYLIAGWSTHYLLYWQTVMYNYHTTRTATYSYDSRWWSWPLMLTPLPFRFGTSLREILMMGNPSIWWATYPILVLSLFQVARKRDQTLTYLLVAFLASWLPFGLLSRFQVIYYYYASLPLLILIIGYWLKSAWRNALGKICVVSYVAIVIYLFVLFYPALTAELIPRELGRSLRWLPGW